jgi:uncharacterized membrane protein YjgN (DUF898 family)
MEIKPMKFTGSLMSFFPLWLKVFLLKVITLGLYAPRGSGQIKNYFYSHTSYREQAFSFVGQESKVIKLRLLFLLFIVTLYFIAESISLYSWIFQSLFLISLPAYYLLEEKLSIEGIRYGQDQCTLKLSLWGLYRSAIIPLSIFLLSAFFIFNSEIIDSRFLASIDNKEEASQFSSDSYITKAMDDSATIANKGHDKKDHGHAHEHEPTDKENWGDSISAEEKSYLKQHEESHNHGSIALSRLQKLQLTDKGNQFAHYVLMLLLMLGLWPWFDYLILRYKFNNTALNHIGFHDASWKLDAGLGSFYWVYGKVLLTLILIGFFIGLIISNLLMGSEGSSAEFWSNALVHGVWLLPIILVVTIITFSLLITWRWQWQLNNLQHEKLILSTKFSSVYWVFLYMSNALMLIITLGLAAPWCRLRCYRYRVESLSVKNTPVKN